MNTPQKHTPEKRRELIDAIRALPEQLEATIAGWSDEQLDFKPAPREWSARQIVHHLADSHMNAFIRTKLALTEDQPTIKPYDQEKVAELADSTGLPLDVSLAILRGLHVRWTYLLDQLTDEQFSYLYYHPEYQRTYSIDDLLTTYAEHGQIHINQINANRKAAGW